MRILAVEDDPVSLRVLAKTLKTLGWEVEQAVSAEHAWALLEKHMFRIVVADWRLPGEDGLQLCRRVRARGGDYVYFMLLTEEEATEANEGAANQAGVDDFLSKPVRPYQLENRLRVAKRILSYTAQVRELEAILPICGYCKKVRNDGNYWEQIEDYLSRHAGAPLSPGVCPDCYQARVLPLLEQAGEGAAASAAGPHASGARPTLGMIARRLGVSSAAVSMALRNHTRISVELRNRVATVAQEIGYRPDPEVRKVMRHLRVSRKARFNSVLYGLTHLAKDEYPSHLSDLVRGCETRAVQRGYGFAVFRIRGIEEVARLQRMLISRGVEGVVLLSASPEMASLRELVDWTHFSVITTAEGEALGEFDAVRPHWRYTVKRTYQELEARGYRRIGAVLDADFDACVDHLLSTTVRGLRGLASSDVAEPFLFRRAQAIASSEGALPGSLGPCLGPESGPVDWTGLPDWYVQGGLDALVFDHDVHVDSALEELARAGLKPGCVAILGRSDGSRHPGVCQRSFDIGYAAVEALAHKIEQGLRGYQNPPAVTKIKGRWVLPPGS
ncbi:hypothetical protein DB347_15205 [Opitutaceae bacterium EW11]|nr:hypothetical protein DB347_15205 [Opitutaceae bacterium EW11]